MRSRMRMFLILLTLLAALVGSYAIVRTVETAGTGFTSLGVLWACTAALLLVLTEEGL